ncbi:VOC family protein [Allomuricauda sp. SCSIO 65647]|uniref:VOC family protein n=1 Tax=Allomuricauda sp. SCSIO 65647 TaxID=2908843 RepID=UPI001F35A7BD|nr:VOC family protein [Muricauda sp. SCSIO 65647]UJH66438.1 VOC family protein [Muricauda sp. SCSIO 65647]
MTKNNFVFADLSTYELKTAQQFYANVFDWEYVTEDDLYHLATYQGKEISGLYETPQKFKDMNMPSFWMGYIQVENVQETVAKARAFGGIIELVDTENAIGDIALIRDPLGAGFTVYEGNQLASRYENAENALVWNELFISDLKKVQPFYEGVFSWSISPGNNHRHFILDSKEKQIGAIQEVSNELKGKYEYWGVFFAVDNVATTKQRVLQNGGSLIFEDENFTALADPFGAFFHVVPLEKNSTVTRKDRSKKSFKWKAMLGLGLILVYFITGWPWIWALFFAFWVYMDLRSGYTHLFEPVQKKQNPLLYWIVVAMWAFLGVYSVLYYTDPQWFYA